MRRSTTKVLLRARSALLRRASQRGPYSAGVVLPSTGEAHAVQGSGPDEAHGLAD